MSQLDQPHIKESIAELREALRGRHEVNIHIRKDGQDLYFEADWLDELLDKLV